MAYTSFMSEKAKRLRQAREETGYGSASAAARVHGWGVSTFLAHENGQNDYDADQAQTYAKAFKTTAEWLLWGKERPNPGLDQQLQELPIDAAEQLIREFNNMIKVVKLVLPPK
jgi:phage repressor protein C with HTH and peptisase S24 domain